MKYTILLVFSELCNHYHHQLNPPKKLHTPYLLPHPLTKSPSIKQSTSCIDLPVLRSALLSHKNLLIHRGNYFFKPLILFLSKKSLSHSHKKPFANLVFRIHGCRISSENIILRSFGEVGNYIPLDDPIQMHTIIGSVLSSMEMRSPEVNELTLPQMIFWGLLFSIS